MIFTFIISHILFPIMPCSNTQLNNLDMIPTCYILTNLSLFLNKISIPNAKILMDQTQVSIRHASKCLLYKVGVFFLNILKNKLKIGSVKNLSRIEVFPLFSTFFSFYKNPTQMLPMLECHVDVVPNLTFPIVTRQQLFFLKKK